MQSVILKTPLSCYFELQIHTTAKAMRRWLRQHAELSAQEVPPSVFAMCSKYYIEESKIAPHRILIISSEEVEPGSPGIVHEFVHAADFASIHAPRGIDRMEFRAYLVTALMLWHKLWFENKFVFDESQFEHVYGYLHLALSGG